ncbi:MAG TPA: hypothetical protein GXX65_03010 [Methanosarcina sp.]|nr:hypothetical protein [Methanosarcina sp.]
MPDSPKTADREIYLPISRVFGLKPRSFQLPFENIVIAIAVSIGNTNHIPMPRESPLGCSGRVESTRTPITH